MNDEQTLLTAIHTAPQDDLAWLALGDWLEESGQSQRAELLRCWRQLRAMTRRARGRAATQRRMVELLATGVRPCVPQVVNSMGMHFSLVPPGTFWMGSPTNETNRSTSELIHEVEITQPFYLGVFEVTQDQYQRLTGENPSHFSAAGNGRNAVKGMDTSQHPVEEVTWLAAVDFCRLLSELPAEKKAKRVYRLPTEAEWEYACRAGTTTPMFVGRTLSATQANFDGSAPYGRAKRGPYYSRTMPVGTFPPNVLGLYDMHGNIWEWCQDWYNDSYYQHSPREDPSGPSGGRLKVLRGGSCYSNGQYCRSACRFHCVHDTIQYRCRGLRVVLNHSGGATRR